MSTIQFSGFVTNSQLQDYDTTVNDDCFPPNYHKMEIPNYDGSIDYVSWIIRCDKLFAPHIIPNKFHTKLASYYLDGDTQLWFNLLI